MSGVYLIVGHYGTGKSEFAVSLAMKIRGESGEAVTLVDLDVVNPYFRSREARGVLEAAGVRVVGNALNIDRGVDLPAISPAAAGSLETTEGTAIVDLGGDPAGARVIRRFGSGVSREGIDVLYVVNRYRPENRDVKTTIASFRAVEEALGLHITALVNNTHLLDRTTPEHLRKGDLLCREVAEKTGVPIRFIGATPELLRRIRGESESEKGRSGAGQLLQGEPVEIGMYLREEWMASAPGIE